MVPKILINFLGYTPQSFEFGFQLEFASQVPVNNMLGLLQIMTWHRMGSKPNLINSLRPSDITHIYVGKLTIIGSDYGLSPGRRQVIICTNARILLIRPLGTNFSEILIGIQTFSFKKMHLKMHVVQLTDGYICVIDHLGVHSCISSIHSV